MRTLMGWLCIPLVVKLSLAAAAPSTTPATATRPAWATEETVGKMCDARIRNLRPMLVDAYGLTADQQQRVDQVLARLKREQIAWTIRTAAERVEWGRQGSGSLRAAAEAGNLASLPAEFHEARSGLNAMNAANPLFTFDSGNALTAVEATLPEAQARAGRTRFNEMQAQRMSAVERELERAITAGGPDDVWRRFVDRFCGLFNLDDGQRGTAQSILREAIDKRAETLRQYAKRTQGGRQDGRALRASVTGVFNEMRDRLDAIPTRSQFALVQAGSNPGAVATRPTDYAQEQGASNWPASAPAARFGN